MRTTKKKRPNPGSEEAIGAGCKCPVLDNNYGKGTWGWDFDGNPLFWVNQECPMHGAKDK